MLILSIGINNGFVSVCLDVTVFSSLLSVKVIVYSINKFFVEVHYLPQENKIDFIEVIESNSVIKLYSDRVSIKIE